MLRRNNFCFFFSHWVLMCRICVIVIGPCSICFESIIHDTRRINARYQYKIEAHRNYSTCTREVCMCIWRLCLYFFSSRFCFCFFFLSLCIRFVFVTCLYYLPLYLNSSPQANKQTTNERRRKTRREKKHHWENNLSLSLAHITIFIFRLPIDFASSYYKNRYQCHFLRSANDIYANRMKFTCTHASEPINQNQVRLRLCTYCLILNELD